MVYIHGGGFIMGASFKYSPDLFIENDVILVTLNYRLGVFGRLLLTIANINKNFNNL